MKVSYFDFPSLSAIEGQNILFEGSSNNQTSRHHQLLIAHPLHLREFPPEADNALFGQHRVQALESKFPFYCGRLTKAFTSAINPPHRCQNE